MSFEKQAGVLQVVWYTGSIENNTATTDRSGTTALPGKEPGFEGVFFDGTIREEPGNLLRVLRWSSYDASRKSSETTNGGGADHISSTAHYQMYDPTPLDEKPECIEFVTIQLKPSVSFADFYREWAPALKLVSAFDGCPYAALGQGIEDPQSVVQIQPWETLDNHLIGFKKAPNVNEVMGQLYPIIETYVEGGKAGMKGGHIMLDKE